MREFAAYYFDRAAEKRDYWAAEHDDQDSRISAVVLRDAASYVRNLSATDERFNRLADAFAREEITETDLDVLSDWLEGPDQVMSSLGDRFDPAALVLRYGYRTEPNPETFLSLFVAKVESELPKVFENWRTLSR
jgi:hypothetical protein